MNGKSYRAYDLDIAEAMHAGCTGALVARPGMVLNLLQPTPEIIVPALSLWPLRY